MEPKAVIKETLISIDDPAFGPYNPITGNGTIAKILDFNGIKYFESLAPLNWMRPPPDDYEFRYLTGLPQVNVTKHWKLHFKHYITNLRGVEIENCQMDGWHAYLIAPDGVLWRLYKYQVESPASLPPYATIVANATYQIHNIPEHRVTFLFSFISGGAAIDSWGVGREVIRFVGFKYDLPRIALKRISPGKVEIVPPRFIEYSFSIKNVQGESLEMALDYKFGETTVWEMNLWPSGHQGEIKSMELILRPLESKTMNISAYFPEDKDDHGVLVYFGVIIVRGALAPPLKGEIWENLYGSNSYLGIKQSWFSMGPHGVLPNNSDINLFVVVAPYVSPFSKDVLPGDHYVRFRIFDAHYRSLLHGPVDLLIDAAIRKGSEMILNYTIPKEFFAHGEGRYMAQIDTFRRGEKGMDMNLARVSIPFQLKLPDLSVKGLVGHEDKVIAKIENLGHWPAHNATIAFYVDGAKLSEKSISIGPGEIEIVEFDLKPGWESAPITVECLLSDSLPDANPGNNKASVILAARGETLDPLLALLSIISIVAVAILVLALKKGRGLRSRDRSEQGLRDGP
jgi:hypothetical protein